MIIMLKQKHIIYMRGGVSKVFQIKKIMEENKILKNIKGLFKSFWGANTNYIEEVEIGKLALAEGLTPNEVKELEKAYKTGEENNKLRRQRKPILKSKENIKSNDIENIKTDIQKDSKELNDESR